HTVTRAQSSYRYSQTWPMNLARCSYPPLECEYSFSLSPSFNLSHRHGAEQSMKIYQLALVHAVCFLLVPDNLLHLPYHHQELSEQKSHLTLSSAQKETGLLHHSSVP